VPLASLLAFLLLPAAVAPGDEERVPGYRTLFDFESGTYAGFSVSGEAFGKAPLEGEAPDQQPIHGYLGRFLANGFVHGDRPRGTLRSEPFLLDRPYLRLRVGGGRLGVAVRLLVDGKARFEAAGRDSEAMLWHAWDVRPFQGRRARIVVEDDSDGYWGHILVDHVQLVDEPGCVRVSMGPRHRILDPSAGEARPWYVNDHCFVRHTDGTWHLFGITHPEPADPLNEVLFAHATSPRLHRPGWRTLPPALAADPVEAKEQHVWAPHVVRHDGLYHMVYCAGDVDHARYRIHLATSRDLTTWTRHPRNPLFADGYDARDPCLLRHGERWLLYYTATSTPTGGNHVVKVRTSDDLLAWSEATVAYRDPARGTFGGPTESPYVLERGGAWYLFIGPRGGYVGTDVYRSLDPLNFAPEDKVGFLDAHAAEVVRDEEGSWWVSHAGWGQGGVWLAPLYWADGA
jgi:beta-fructofuranosidase